MGMHIAYEQEGHTTTYSAYSITLQAAAKIMEDTIAT